MFLYKLKTILSFSTLPNTLYVFHLSTKLHTVHILKSGKLIFHIYSRYYFSFEQCNYTLSPTTPVFVESTIYNCIFACANIQLNRRLTLTSRPALAGIPIIYHQTGILSIVGVNLRIKL